jgi:hypothetical protein
MRRLKQAAILFAALTLIGCGDTPEDDQDGGMTSDCEESAFDHPNVECEILDGSKVYAISGEITEDLTLEPVDGLLQLRGQVFVGNGSDETVLEIEPGTTILAGPGDPTFLTIRRNSDIMAEGTASDPIVMTPTGDDNSRGQWGGLIINGKAPLNTGDEAEGEGGTGFYGGDDPEDNSGVLKYVRVEYAGDQITSENELNGIAFQGVGSETTISHIQVHRNSDDGVEFFGGTAEAKYIYLTEEGDDSLDWTDGWRGKVQHVVIHQSADGEGDRGIEADNLEGSPTATPRTRPIISNMTIIGGGDGNTNEGVLFRRGTGVKLYNTLITNAGDACIDLDTEATYTFGYDGGSYTGDLTIQNSKVGGCAGGTFKNGDEDFTPPFTVSEWFNNWDSNIEGTPQFEDVANADYRPVQGSDAATTPGVQPSGDDFFDSTSYMGGVDPNDNWLEGWTIKPEEPGTIGETEPERNPGEESDNVECNDTGQTKLCAISGELTEDFTIEPLDGVTWQLQGQVFVGNGQDETVLTIEEGSEILAGPGDPTFLTIRRNSKIMAEGTKDAPIVMRPTDWETDKSRGQWGGLIINGKAPLNTGQEAEGEGGTGFYGGNDPEDNSGVLRYVRVEYAGDQITSENELNGIAFQGVGSETTIEYIQVHKNSDDGVEFFGGTAEAKYIYLTEEGDDSLDWTDGWRGKVQHVIIHQGTDDGDRGIEADNLEGSPTATPRTMPTISNMTVIGGGEGATNEGVLFRRGTGVKLYNTLITNAGDACIDLDTEATYTFGYDGGSYTGNLTIQNSKVGGCAGGTFKDGDEDFTPPFTVSEWFNNWDSNIEGEPQLTDIAGADYRPASGSDAANTQGVQPSGDDFFDSTSYIGGASPDSDWTDGWTTEPQTWGGGSN